MSNTTTDTNDIQAVEALARSFGWDILARKNGFAVCSPNRPPMGDNVSITIVEREEVLTLVRLGYAPKQSEAMTAVYAVGAHLSIRSNAGFASVDAALSDEDKVTNLCHECGLSFDEAQSIVESLGL